MDKRFVDWVVAKILSMKTHEQADFVRSLHSEPHVIQKKLHANIMPWSRQAAKRLNIKIECEPARDVPLLLAALTARFQPQPALLVT